MTIRLTRATHAYAFRVADVPDVTVQGTTITPDTLTVEFLDREGARTTRAIVSGPDREDGTLSRVSRHSLPVPADHWPEWVAFEVAGCTPDGWER